MQKEFNEDMKYNLFRSVKDILHPSISKKNVSNYNIILDENILPVEVFYPKKVSHLNKVIVYIRGNGKVTDCTGKYQDICNYLSKALDSILIAVEYKEEKSSYKKMYNDIYETIKYVYSGLIRNNIDPENIVLMGDSTGCNIITGINYLNKDIEIKNEILFYPVLSMDYFNEVKYESMVKNNEFNLELLPNLRSYYEEIVGKDNLDDILINPLKRDNYSSVPKTLIIVGNVDSLKDEAKEYFEKLDNGSKYAEIEFSAHGFLKKIDKDIEKELLKEITSFLK